MIMSVEIVKVNDNEIKELAALAEEIWRQHFPPIIGDEQVTYMLEKFQSEKAMKEQIKEGYEYYFLKLSDENIGYFGIEPMKDGSLFLSKLYIRLSQRGNGYARQAFEFMKELCRKRGYKSIWLTVNKYNVNTIEVYKKFGMKILRSQVSDIGNGFVMDDYVFGYDI